MAFKHASGLDTIEAGQWEITGKVVRTSEKALLIDDGTRREWLPLSRIHIVPGRDLLGLEASALVPGQVVSVLMPEWLAKEKGFV